jgi:hypothetical protein
MTSKETILGWIEEGIAHGHTHMLVVCDSFTYEDYPVYVPPEHACFDIHDVYANLMMQKVMEIYDLRKDINSQLNSVRAWEM